VEVGENFVQDSSAIPIKIDLLFYPTSASIKQIGKQGRPVDTPDLKQYSNGTLPLAIYKHEYCFVFSRCFQNGGM